MQIKLFTIPIIDSGKVLEEMNIFLKSNKILGVQDQLVSNESGMYWCFCIRYIECGLSGAVTSKEKIDYKYVLNDSEFKRFSRMREIRKKVAAEQGIPAFAVFTDEELAGLAKMEEVTRESMMSVKGIGDKKVERFAEHFIGISES